MPAKKKDDKAAEAPASKVSDTPKDSRVVAGEEIAAETALRDAREAALVEDRVTAKADANGDIDERMAALEKDHIAMGARPKG